MSRFSRRAQLAVAANIGAELSLSPVSGTFNNGDTVVVTVYENSYSEAVNAVQANFSYSTSQLTFQSISISSGAFPTQIQATGGNGLVQIGVGLLASSVTGRQEVARITFTANGNGTGPLAFTTGSAIARSSDSADICKKKTGSSYTISGAEISLSPASGSLVNGNTLVVTIMENSYSESVNAVQANFSYPTAQMTFQSISTTNSAFPAQVQATGGSGLVQIGVGILSGSVTGTQEVARVTFTLSGTGAAALAFTSGTGIARSSDSTDICTKKTGSSYTVS